MLVLTKNFSPGQYEQALESWAWIGVNGKTPVVASLFGDVILQDRSGYWFLDTTMGTFGLVWPNRDAVQAALDSPEGQDKYLLGVFAMAAERLGTMLAEDQVYDFMPPPILGGSFAPENVIAVDFVVKVNLAGQLHEQLRDLPPDAEITGFTLDETPYE